MPAAAIGAIAAPLIAAGAKAVSDKLFPASDGKEGEEERISDKPRNLMDPAMQKLKEMHLEDVVGNGHTSEGDSTDEQREADQ